MNVFGWDYPPGADNDPNAPWNDDGRCSATFGDDGLPCELDYGHYGSHETTDPNAVGGPRTIEWVE